MVAEHRHRRIEAAVLERQLLGNRPDDRHGALGPLGDHDLGRLDRDHVQILRLIRPRARANVDHRARISEGRTNPRRDPRIGPPDGRIALADLVVELRPGLRWPP